MLPQRSQWQVLPSTTINQKTRKQKGIIVSHHVLHHLSLQATRFSWHRWKMVTLQLLCLHSKDMLVLNWNICLISKFPGEETYLTCIDPTLVQSPIAISQLFLPPKQSYLLFIFWVVSSSGFLSPSSWHLSIFQKYLTSFCSTDNILPCYPLCSWNYLLYIISKEFCSSEVNLDNLSSPLT